MVRTVIITIYKYTAGSLNQQQLSKAAFSSCDDRATSCRTIAMTRTLTTYLLLFLVGCVQNAVINETQGSLKDELMRVVKDIYNENQETFKNITEAANDLYSENQATVEKVVKVVKDLYNETYPTFRKIAKEKIGSSVKEFFNKNKATFTNVGKAAAVEVRKFVEMVARRFLAQLFGGVRSLGNMARMVSAISSALEILMSVILKNLMGFTIPNQIFNLLQIVFYFGP